MRTLKRKLFRYDKSSNTFGFLKSSSFFNLSGSFRILSLRLFFFFFNGRSWHIHKKNAIAILIDETRV